MPGLEKVNLRKSLVALFFTLPLSLLACSETADTNGGTGASAGTTGGGGGPADGAGGSRATGGDSPTLSGGGATSGGTNGEGTGGSASPAVPSQGCGKSGRPANGTATGTNYIIDFPPDYDGTLPSKMVLGLHAAGNPITQIQSLTNGSRVAENFVRVYPKSEGSAWDYGKDKARIDATFTDVLTNYCVDESRIYLTGHSSGAGMAVQLICDGDTRFAGVAPVAAWKVCNSFTAIPALYIQGIADAQRGGSNGKDVVDVFAASNSCSTMTSPTSEIPGCTSGFNGKPVTPGCVTYADCTAPLIWCSHNDEGYNTTNGHYHGWPCFASNAIADFFDGLP